MTPKDLFFLLPSQASLPKNLAPHKQPHSSQILAYIEINCPWGRSWLCKVWLLSGLSVVWLVWLSPAHAHDLYFPVELDTNFFFRRNHWLGYTCSCATRKPRASLFALGQAPVFLFFTS